MNNDRIAVITGVGVVSPNAIGKEDFHKALQTGKNAIEKIDSFDTRDFPSKIAGECRDFNAKYFVKTKDIHKMGRAAHMGIAAAKLAVEDSGIKFTDSDRSDCPVFIGSSIGGMDFAEPEFHKFFNKGLKSISPFAGVAVFCASVSSEISRYLSLKGKSMTFSTGCASASDAIGHALHDIRYGNKDIVICGGSDACVTPGVLAAFCQMRVTSTKYNDTPKIASRPFDKGRDGFVIGEGAWIMVVEEKNKALKRGARVYAELGGYGATCDAYHITSPNPEGTELVRAMKIAIKEAGIAPKDINYISAYGNGTRVNDPYETMVIKKVFGKHAYDIKISSLKSMTGHPIGSSGAAEVAAASLCIYHGFIPPTINHDNPDPKCDLNYVPNESIQADVKNALCNTLSFGGKNAVIVLKGFKG